MKKVFLMTVLLAAQSLFAAERLKATGCVTGLNSAYITTVVLSVGLKIYTGSDLVSDSGLAGNIGSDAGAVFEAVGKCEKDGNKMEDCRQGSFILIENLVCKK